MSLKLEFKYFRIYIHLCVAFFDYAAYHKVLAS